VTTAISDEARAKHHEAVRGGSRQQYQGLTFWSPNINIFRDPRWGRGQETLGEDPYLTGELGVAYVRGLQGDHPRYLKTAACAKHFAAHSGPEALRHEFNARVSDQDLWDTYLPAFEKLVKAGVESVMGAYNRTNDEPCCGSQLLLVDVLRGLWKFSGHVVSDCWAIQDFHLHHKVTRNALESAALALGKGCDLNCGCIYENLDAALKDGLVTEAQIDLAVRRLFRTRLKLGMFDDPKDVPYASIPFEVVNCETHRKLAREAAARSIVLLKNKGGILPLSKDIKSVLVMGPSAASVDVMLGNYYGLSSKLVTILEGITGKASSRTRIDYRLGCLAGHPNAIMSPYLGGEAKNVEATIVCMGLTPSLEGEEGDAIASPENGDRREIGMEPNQVAFLKEICEAGGRVVLVVTGGSAISLEEVHDLVEAIIWVWYPGEEGGNAVADILFGDASPSGRLPITIPKRIEDIPPYDDYSMAGRTYRYMTREPLYPFGFGLGYTQFRYDSIALDKTVKTGESLDVTATVTNTGAREGDEIVQCYLRDCEATTRVPIQKLVGFTRVSLKPGASVDVKFAIKPEMMALIDEQGKARIEPGSFEVIVGGSSTPERACALGAASPQRAQFQLV
jgi:beta-glucosidase